MRRTRREIRFELSIGERTSARWTGDERFGWTDQVARIQFCAAMTRQLEEGKILKVRTTKVLPTYNR